MPPARARMEIESWTNVSMRVVCIDAVMPLYGPNEGEVAMYAPTVPGNLRGGPAGKP